MNSGSAEKGIILIELLIALALMMIVSSGLLAVYWAGNNVFQHQSGHAEAQYSARAAMQFIVKDIKATDKPPVIKENGHLINLSVKGETIEYRVRENEYGSWLYQNNLPIADITYISFARPIDYGLIEVTVTAGPDSMSYTLKTGVRPRIYFAE